MNKLESEIKEIENNKEEMLIIPIEMLARAIGRNKKIYSYIDDMYKKNQYNYYKNVCENEVMFELYNSKFFEELNFETQIYSKKVFCILCYEYSLEETNYVQNIIIKGWRYIYNFIKNKDNICLSDVITNYIYHNKRWTVNELGDISIITYIISTLYNKTVIKNEKSYRYLYELVEQCKSKKNGIRTQANYFSGKINWNSIDKIIELIFSNIGTITDVESFFYETTDESEKRLLKMSALFETENLELTEIFENRKILKQDIRDIIGSYFIVNSENKHMVKIQDVMIEDVDISEVTKFLINNLYLKLLMNEYNSVKHYYFDNVKKSITEIDDMLNNINKKYESEIKIKNEKYSILLAEYNKILKENKNLKKSLEEVEENKEEIVELREFIFNLDNEEECVELVIEDKIDNIKAIVVGGSPKWQLKLKERYNSWHYLSVENLNFDEDIVKNAEVVIIYVNYLSHALYYKVINIVRKYNLKVKYIKSNQNIDIVQKDIFNSINNLFYVNKTA